MELAGEIPLAVGAAALRLLNSYLDDRKIAKSWYGNNHRIFTTRTWTKGYIGLRISYVFAVPEDRSMALIEQSVHHSSSWHKKSKDGACCWLPIYRSLEDNFRKDTVVKAHSALSSIGTVSSLPAARINAWCMVVMAHANGARSQIFEINGAYLAVLRAKHFVLTIRRKTLVDQMVAHIELRQTAFAQAEDMPRAQWESLLHCGHSFGKTNNVQWLLDGTLANGPPLNLASGVHDEELCDSVVDAQLVTTLEGRLRTCLRKCDEAWNVCLEDAVTHSHDYALQMDQNRHERYRKYDDQGNPKRGSAPDMNKQRSNDLGPEIKKLLNRIRSTLVNYNGTLTHVVFDVVLDVVYEMQKKPESAAAESYCNQSPYYNEAIKWHNATVALARALCLIGRLDKVLSTRGTGDTMLLA